MLDDIASMTMRQAMNGLAARQRVIADNIANVQTPNFTAHRVMFEDALKSAVATGDKRSVASAGPTTENSLEPTRLDGNNVNLDHEILANVDTNLRFQLATQVISGKASTMRTAMRTN